MRSLPEQFAGSESETGSDEIALRCLTAADVRRAMQLKEQAGWNQTESDWRRLLSLEPDGCFAAVSGKTVVGTVTTTRYGRDLAWIGMVLVDADLRRRGIATRLMRRALAFLDAQKIRAVKLDATRDGAFVYENLGFVAESTIERWARAADAAGKQEFSSRVQETEILEFDRLHFAADRSSLLKKLLAETHSAPLAVFGGEKKLTGYALTRRGARANYLGPLVAENAQSAESLLDAALAQLADGEIFIDVNSKFGGYERILTARGFARQRELVRMRRGAPTDAASGAAVFAIAGFEVG